MTSSIVVHDIAICCSDSISA